jgi:hypothetical protein
MVGNSDKSVRDTVFLTMKKISRSAESFPQKEKRLFPFMGRPRGNV